MRYTAASTVEDALAALAAGDAEVVAGGTDLVVGYRSGRRGLPESLVAIHDIRSLKQLEAGDDGGLTIGALVSHETLYRSNLVREVATAVADGAAVIGSPATRHQGTIGGNLANGSPAMDTGAPLVVLGAEVTLRSTQAQRTIPVEDLLVGPGRTSIGSTELLASVCVPRPESAAGSAYVRLEYRRAMEITVVGAAALVVLDADCERIKKARVALTSVAPTIVTAGVVDRSLEGARATRERFDEAARTAAESARPITDVRASADYRRAMVAVIVRRALEAATARARGDGVPVPATHHCSGA